MAERKPTAAELFAVYQAQCDARHDLCAFARYIDIPGVPQDDGQSDRRFEVVETELARHHVMVLNALQAMYEGTLAYDPETLAGSITYAQLRGDEPPAGGRFDGGVGDIQVHAPSPNSAKSCTDIPIQTTDSVQSGVQNHGNVSPDGSTESIQAMKLTSNGYPLVAGVERSWRKFGVVPEGYEVCRRVMLMLPPGSAKSTYGSVVFPTWVFGRERMFEMILTGWGDPICRRHGKRARQVVASPQYRAVFNEGLDPATKAAEDWATTNGSSYKSSGISSGVAGFRCGGLGWDDLTKNRKEADSQTIRDDVYNAYIDDARSRKTPGAWEFGIGTRWHEDEIMGRILPEGYAGESGFMRCRDGNVWFVICMAAECEREDDPLGREVGEMLWTEWFTEDYWAEKRVVPRSWASLYQQRPAPEEGIQFKGEWFKRYTQAPENLNYYIAYDPAVTEEEGGDDTAIQVWGVDDKFRLYLLEEWVHKRTMDVWVEKLIHYARLWKPLEVISESGVIRRAAEPYIKKAMRQHGVFFRDEFVTRHANKSAMARGAEAMAAAGQVYVMEGPEGDKFIDECKRFPASKDDHRVDAFVNLCLRLEGIWEADGPREKTEERVIIGGSFGGDEMKVKDFMPPKFKKRKSRWSRKVH
jgi:predicted phage terminase large subunit-like protein